MGTPASGERVTREYRQAKSARSVNWESHWQDVANLCFPTREFNVSLTPGTKRSRRIYDSTAANALIRFASALHGLGTNPAIKWFALHDEDPSIDEDDEVRNFYSSETNAILALFNSPQFGFNTQAHEVYLDLAGFGSGAMIHMPMPLNDGIRFQARPLQEITWKQNSFGKIDTVYRCFTLTAEQAEGEFGRQNLPKAVLDKLDSPTSSQDLDEYLHAVFPRKDRNPESLLAIDRPWASVNIHLGTKEKLTEGGFDIFPYITPRMTKAPNEDYGRSPAMDALAEIGMLNQMAKTLIIAAEKTVDPPLVVEANSIKGSLKTAPAGITWRRPGGRNPIDPLFTGQNLQWAEFMVNRSQKMIQESFFFDVIGPLPVIDRQTAVEVMQRIQQQGSMMAPILSRLESEFWEPVVLRTLGMRFQMGMMGDIPEKLRGRNTKVRFMSTLASAQRAASVQAIDQFAERIAAYSQFDPDARHVFDAVEASRIVGTDFNVDPRVIRTDDEVVALQDAERQAEAAQNQAVADATQASAAKDGAEALETVSGL